jgi:acyl carrier protein
MNYLNISKRIRQFIQTTFPLARKQSALSDHDSLFSSGIVDSLGVLDLVTYLENEFGVMVADEDLLAENFESIGRMAEFVTLKQQDKVLV